MRKKIQILLDTLFREGNISIISLGHTAAIEVELRAEITKTSVIQCFISINENEDREQLIYEETIYNYIADTASFYEEVIKAVNLQLEFFINDLVLIKSRING